MLHNLFHSHTEARKPGVGEVLFCRNRITGRVEVGITLANGLRMELPYSRAAVTALARAESADEFEAMAKVFGAEVVAS